MTDGGKTGGIGTPGTIEVGSNLPGEWLGSLQRISTSPVGGKGGGRSLSGGGETRRGGGGGEIFSSQELSWFLLVLLLLLLLLRGDFSGEHRTYLGGTLRGMSLTGRFRFFCTRIFCVPGFYGCAFGSSGAKIHAC